MAHKGERANERTKHEQLKNTNTKEEHNLNAAITQRLDGAPQGSGWHLLCFKLQLGRLLHVRPDHA
jgi:hypothetical protein